MSYILEALRKADAERERGAVPDIHTQPLFANDGDESPRRPPWVVPVLGASVVLLVAALAFVLLRGRDDATVAARAAQGSSGSVVPAPSAVATPKPPAAPPAQASAAPPPTSPAAAPRESSGAAAPRTDAPAARTPPASLREAAPPAARKPAPEAPARADKRETVAAAAPPTAAAERVHSINELPDDVRRQLPNFTFGGAVYSDNAANRMLIVNGQLFNEGGQPAPGVMLDQIRLKSAVFRYRGYRYEMPY